jgi:hypothetical protein
MQKSAVQELIKQQSWGIAWRSCRILSIVAALPASMRGGGLGLGLGGTHEAVIAVAGSNIRALDFVGVSLLLLTCLWLGYYRYPAWHPQKRKRTNTHALRRRIRTCTVTRLFGPWQACSRCLWICITKALLTYDRIKRSFLVLEVVIL